MNNKYSYESYIYFCYFSFKYIHNVNIKQFTKRDCQKEETHIII